MQIVKSQNFWLSHIYKKKREQSLLKKENRKENQEINIQNMFTLQQSLISLLKEHFRDSEN